MTPRVVVTGTGVVASVGIGSEAFEKALYARMRPESNRASARLGHVLADLGRSERAALAGQ